LRENLLQAKNTGGNRKKKRPWFSNFTDEILMALTGRGGVFDTKIAFVGRKGKHSEIYTINFDGSDPVKITAYNSLTLVPHWSPDGSKISFTSYKDGNPDCYIINPASGKTKKNILF